MEKESIKKMKPDPAHKMGGVLINSQSVSGKDDRTQLNRHSKNKFGKYTVSCRFSADATSLWDSKKDHQSLYESSENR